MSEEQLQMSEEQLKAFWEAIQADAGLQQKLQGVTEPDAIVAIAKEAGFMISADELQRAQAEISEEDLGGVVGGREKVGLLSQGQCSCHSAT
ncbi:MAG: Nif11-like leader peptide family natural product precursor [Methanothrix sp.]